MERWSVSSLPKTFLKVSINPDDWCFNLPFILLQLRGFIKEELNTSPAEMLYVENLRLPAEIAITNHKCNLEDPLRNFNIKKLVSS